MSSRDPFGHHHHGHHGGPHAGHEGRHGARPMRPSDLILGGVRHEGTVTGYRRPYDCTYKCGNAPALAAGAESDPLPMYWPVSGIVRELQGTVISSDESIIQSGSRQAMALMWVTITIADGREDLFKSAAASGNAGAAFTSFASLFGLDGERICTLERIVKNAYAWSIRFQAMHTAQNVTLTPELVAFLDEDPRGVYREGNRVSVPVGTEVEVYGGRAGNRIIETT